MEMGRTRLGPDDWANAALRSLAVGGVAAVSIEALSKQLSATRGSFYWHFEHRDALLTAAMELWERLATTAVLAQVAAESDPQRRLRDLIRYAITVDPVPGLEPAITAGADHPAIGPVLRRVTATRIEALAEGYRHCGLMDGDARRAAVVAYSGYLGWLDLKRILGDHLPEVDVDTPTGALTLDLLLAEIIDQPIAQLARPPVAES
jgi:AcrR family transcriptional regulator